MRPTRKTLSKMLWVVMLLVLPAVWSGCDSSTLDLIDLALNDPDRKPIDQSRVGVNNFFVDREFGTIPQQFSEIRNTLGVHYVRVLFAWTTAVQSSPSATPNYSFYDSILDAIPPDVDVLIVLAHTPDWMSNSANWTSNGNPRLTWVERWLQPTVQRYKNRGGIIGWEIFNEPDALTVPSDAALDLTNPDNYFELLRYSSEVIRVLDPTRLKVMAATEAINQDFPMHLDYNKRLRDLGAADLVDIWNIHYYGKSFDRVIQANGIADFLNGLGKLIWITESGVEGPNNQLAYAEQVWPFLRENISNIDRIYYYEFASPVMPLESNFGLKTTDPALPVSDLYINLRDN